MVAPNVCPCSHTNPHCKGVLSQIDQPSTYISVEWLWLRLMHQRGNFIWRDDTHEGHRSILRPSITLLGTFIVLQSVTVHKFYGWTDNMYMHIVQRGQLEAQVDITLTRAAEGNGMKYTFQSVLSRSHISIPPRVSDSCPIDIWIAIRYYRGIARASFHQNLRGLLLVTQEAIMVISNIWVGDENAREILPLIKINHGFIDPIGFIGGVYLIWDSSKVFLVPYKLSARTSLSLSK